MDALESVRLVGADGKLITVSPTSYPDLWWGLLGAGANFGVVTSATYKLHPLENNGDVFLADFYFPGSMSQQYFDVVEANYSELPANLAQILIVSWNETINDVSNIVSMYSPYGSSENINTDCVIRFKLVPTGSISDPRTKLVKYWLLFSISMLLPPMAVLSNGTRSSLYLVVTLMLLFASPTSRGLSTV
jgi:hypothetical protein